MRTITAKSVIFMMIRLVGLLGSAYLVLPIHMTRRTLMTTKAVQKCKNHTENSLYHVSRRACFPNYTYRSIKPHNCIACRRPYGNRACLKAGHSSILVKDCIL